MGEVSNRDTEQQGEVILVDKRSEGRIWVITLNRPHRMNSLGDNLGGLLSDTLAAYRDDKQARVAIITGAGTKAFCAGADLLEAAAMGEAKKNGVESPVKGMGPLDFMNMAENMNLWKPTIAAINGYAIAGGFMLAMNCDIRIMAENAKVGIGETRWNMPGAMWMAPLCRQMPQGCALELTMWGDTQYTAERCYQIGWAQAVVPKEELLDKALEYADRMLDMGPRSVRNNKEMVYRGAYMDPLESQRWGSALEQNLRGMTDTVEGLAAFAEKRRPVFRDE
ncbi:MAG: enoyl-CoA hydratase/isomerase family protein [Pseudomonadales bacterium]|nr:enoyl-CoA hydratase/isomerase family protein [Pseudomonadales bacterium]